MTPSTRTIAIDGVVRRVELPDDAAKALDKAKLRKKFDALAFTHQKEHVRAITEAKKPEMRAKRIEAMLEKLRARTTARLNARTMIISVAISG